MSTDWPRSREVDRTEGNSNTISGSRAVRPGPVLTLGRSLFLFEIYLFIATKVALSSDTFIAPPMLIFFMLHHWMWLVLPVAFICSYEFLWRPTWLTGLILFLTVIVAGVGIALLRSG